VPFYSHANYTFVPLVPPPTSEPSTKLTAAKAKKATMSPTTAYRIVFLAAPTALASPAEMA